MKYSLHEVAKFASGLVLGDFLCLWWLSTHGGLPVNFLGLTFTSAIVGPGLVFDAVLFAILVHYGWRVGKAPRMHTRPFFLTVGVVFGLVALVHLMRVFVAGDLVVFGWVAPLWLSWIGTAAAAYLSYMSFHLALRAAPRR